MILLFLFSVGVLKNIKALNREQKYYGQVKKYETSPKYKAAEKKLLRARHGHGHTN